MLESLFDKVGGPQALTQSAFLAKLAKFLRTPAFKEDLRWLLLYTHDITCNLSRRNNGYSDIYKKDQ